MSPNEKGVYPDWMSEEDVISQLLKQMVSNGGRLPYSYIIYPEHDSATNERMKGILATMREDKLLSESLHETDDLEIGINGRQALLLGYHRFKQKHRWDPLTALLNKAGLTIIILIIVGIAGGLGYLILHFFKII